MHLVFYDGTCGLCDRTVQFLLRADKQKIFLFAPLQGTTAVEYLAKLPPEQKEVDSLILIENFRTSHSKVYLQSKAVFRMCWLLGGWLKLIGWLSFLSASLFDWAYRFVAHHRYQWVARSCLVPQKDQRDRFLP
ncbi:MAG: thiol-disulfide oxidoreductase DCC family protein [Chlamydiales bacterium]